MSCQKISLLRQIGRTLLIAAVLIIAACSDSNKQQIFDPETGKHIANWITDHRAAFLSDPGRCTPCHGTDYRGGISGVSCYSANYGGTACHANGPGHAAGWATPTVHGPAAKSAPNASAMRGFSTCQICHGTDFTGGFSNRACAACHGGSAPHPQSWIRITYTHTNTDTGNAPVCALCHTNGSHSPIPAPSPAPSAGTSPGCFNATLCHGAAGHPTNWTTPTIHGPAAKSAPSAAAMQGFSSCQPCHGNTFAGDSAHPACFSCHGGSAPHPVHWITSPYTHTNTNEGNAVVCSLCHSAGANSPTTAPPTPAPGTPPGCFNATLCHAQAACGSCHGIPPDGTIAPNVAGRHPQHMAVNASIACGTCHNGAGSGTALHENGTVNVIFDPVYNAISGAAAYNAGSNTCTNVSCHGGQTTPNWFTGTISVNTQCTSCHASGQGQYNGYYSGKHSDHSGRGCTECHDTTKLSSVHFNDLNTTTMTQAYQTLLNSLNYTGTGGGTFGTCTINCHNEDHVGRGWQ
jgi:predicted CxxxxCH...CXXCH cytochrome family protein